MHWQIFQCLYIYILYIINHAHVHSCSYSYSYSLHSHIRRILHFQITLYLRFETLLQKEAIRRAASSASQLQFGAEVSRIRWGSVYGKGTQRTKVEFTSPHSRNAGIEDKGKEKYPFNSFTCDYLVAADGSNSFVRRQLGIKLEGTEQLHTLINVHFTCPGLRPRLSPRPAMLYFVFNETCVAVLVAHDPSRDEWVCQLPIFPPYQTLQDYDTATLQKMLQKILGLSDDSSPKIDINILSVNAWTMHAEVARTFSATAGLSGQTGQTFEAIPRVFLVGDAAHRFPPAGGFGMNTGLQDAHNLAWKLALVCSGNAKETLLHSYNTERRPIAQNITALSMENYEKSASAARVLGVDPNLAKLAVKVATSFPSGGLIPMSVRSAALKAALSTGLSTLKWLGQPGNPLGDVRVNALQSLVQRGKSLPLVFPKEDIDFAYATGALVNANPMTPPSSSKNRGSSSSSSPSSGYTPPELRVGTRIPHCWLGIEGKDASEQGRGRGERTSLHLMSTLDVAAWSESSQQSSSTWSPLACFILVDEESVSTWKSHLLATTMSSMGDSKMNSSLQSTSSHTTTSPLSLSLPLPQVHVIGVRGPDKDMILSEESNARYEKGKKILGKHEMLQRLYQTPPFDDRYKHSEHHDMHASNDNNNSNNNNKYDDNIEGALIRGLYNIDIDVDIDIHNKARNTRDIPSDNGNDVNNLQCLIDVTGKLHSILQNLKQQQSQINKLSNVIKNNKKDISHGKMKNRFAIAVRPDSHVYAILQGSWEDEATGNQSEFNSAVLQFIKSLREALSL